MILKLQISHLFIQIMDLSHLRQVFILLSNPVLYLAAKIYYIEKYNNWKSLISGNLNSIELVPRAYIS